MPCMESTRAYHQPTGVIEVKSDVRSGGTATVWELHNYNSGATAIATPYNAPNQRVNSENLHSPLTQARSRLAVSRNRSARQTDLGELEPREFVCARLPWVPRTPGKHCTNGDYSAGLTLSLILSGIWQDGPGGTHIPWAELMCREEERPVPRHSNARGLVAGFVSLDLPISTIRHGKLSI